MTELPDFKAQNQNNEEQFSKLIASLFPDMDGDVMLKTFNIVSYLNQTRVNDQILPRVIRGIHNIMIGTGHGQVVVHVQGEMVNVSVRETESDIKTRSDK